MRKCFFGDFLSPDYSKTNCYEKLLKNLSFKVDFKMQFPSLINTFNRDTLLQSTQSSRYCIGALDVKKRFKPQVRHQNEVMTKICLWRLLLSRFEEILKNLSIGLDFKLQFPPLILTHILTRNLSGVRSQVAILTEGL